MFRPINSPETELSDPRINYQIRQKILRSENKLSDPAKNSQIRQNRSPEPLPELDSNLSQTIQTNSDLSDQSERLKDDRKMEDLQDIQDIQEERITIQGNGEWGTGNGERRTENGEQGTGNSEGVLRENTTPYSLLPTPSEEDERLENEEFIKYCQGKLPKARDIKRYLLTNDKTTGNRILERLWLEYQQWKTGKNNPNSTGSEYFDNLIDEYRVKSRSLEQIAWEKISWKDKLPCFDLWLTKAKNCRVDYIFTDDNSLGYTRNLRTVFYRWYEQYYVKQSETTIPENPQALGLINAFRQIMGGGHYA